ncbi:MAG TPA: TonB-dependent receptor, partial [Thermoanaerobaculia bacterium]|nr:TonB-dependent receptor [Thermoanaerobaculia bacterium]
ADVLFYVPGVLAQSRWGADETQLSVRGSGLRNNFHHRGLNLLINGVPYQDADGFGDFETLDLMVIERVELWKGANALRHGGNTLGGALNFVTYSGATGAPLEADLLAGSYDLTKAKVGLAGDVGAGGSYFLSASFSDHGGYRDHAEQERTRLFGNLRWQLGDGLEAWVDAIYADVSEELPGALTREQFDADPRQAAANNVAQGYGRFYDYGRLGFGVRRRFGRQSLEATVFAQVRDVDHPIFQVLDQDQRTVGGEVRWSYEGAPADRLERVVVGFAPQVGDNDERRFENLAGERGELVAEFGAEAENLGFYVESQWRLAPRWTLSAGGRFDEATRTYEDRFLADGDRSDERTFSAASPKLGVLWRPSDDSELFANVSRAHEPPLTLELTGFGSPGFLDLEAQDAWQAEIGSRGQLASGLGWQLSLYEIEIDDEIVNENVRPFPGAPFTIPTYRNAEQTRHRGVELGISAPLARDLAVGGDRLSTQLAYTFSDFHFVDDPVFGDNDLPGAPRHVLRAELRYEHPRGHWIAPNVDWSPADYYVDSANTVENDGYAVFNLRGGWQWGRLGLYVEVVNLGDETYSGSVQVDSADGRFYEPADARSFSVGLRWRG